MTVIFRCGVRAEQLVSVAVVAQALTAEDDGGNGAARLHRSRDSTTGTRRQPAATAAAPVVALAGVAAWHLPSATKNTMV